MLARHPRRAAHIAGIPVASIVGRVWAGEPVAVVAEDFDLTRDDVLVACWFAGSHGLPSNRRAALAPSRLWRVRWGRWAGEVDGVLCSPSVDQDRIPDPPTCGG